MCTYPLHAKLHGFLLCLQVLNVDPQKDGLWRQLFESRQHVATDGVHEKDRLHSSVETPGKCLNNRSHFESHPTTLLLALPITPARACL